MYDEFDLYSRPYGLGRDEEEEELRRQALAVPAPASAPEVEPPAPPGFVDFAEPPAVPEPPAPPGFVDMPEQPEEPPAPPGFVDVVEKPEESKPTILGDVAGMAGRGFYRTVVEPTINPVESARKLATEVPEFLEKGINAVRNGWVSGDVAMELQKPNPSISYIAQQQKLADSFKPDEDFNTTWDDKKSPAESFHAFAKDPLGNITQLFASSMGTMVRTMAPYAIKIPERTLQGAIVGAGIGAPAGGVGAGPGAATGARVGARLGVAEMTALSSKAAEYGGSVISSLQEAGVDVRDKDQMERAFSDPKLMATIRDKAEKKGVPIALFDGLSTIIPGNIFSKPGKTVAAKAGQWGTEMLVQMGFAGGGEAGGQLWSEGKINSVRSILAEVGMELVGGIHEIVTGHALTPETEPVAPVIPPVVPPAVPPPIPPTPPEAFAPPPTGVVSPAEAAIAPPGVAPPAPGVVEAPPGEIAVGPPMVSPPIPGAPPVEEAVPPPIPGTVPPPLPPTGDERFAPPVTPPTPEAIEPGESTPAGAAATQVVGAHNLAVKQTANEQSQKLEAANAPATAKAIQQVAVESSADASVTAAEYLAQIKAQRAEEQAEAAAKAAQAAPAVPAAAPGVPPPIPVAATPAAPVVTAPPMAPAPAAPAEAAPGAHAVVVGGQQFTGDTASDAMQAAQTAVGDDAIVSAQTGWVDAESGRFHSHEIFDAHADFNAAIDQAGGNVEAPAVQEAGARLAEAQARDEELNLQIISPSGEQVIATGVKGNEALISIRPSQELAAPLAGVNVEVAGVDAQGQPVIAQRSAAQALNDAKNDRTALSILLDCLH